MKSRKRRDDLKGRACKRLAPKRERKEANGSLCFRGGLENSWQMRTGGGYETNNRCEIISRTVKAEGSMARTQAQGSQEGANPSCNLRTGEFRERRRQRATERARARRDKRRQGKED